MAQSGGAAVNRGKLPPSGAAGEDRLSALPNDVLVLILLRLDSTAEAARTSVLSRRWRRVWHLLPELHFRLFLDGHRIREVLAAPDEPPPLRLIVVATTKDSAADSAGAWLPDAARRLSGRLFYTRMVRNPEEEEETEEEEVAEEEDGEEDAVQLPCFENATTIQLILGLLDLALPLAGTFARLTMLSLYHVRLHGPCELGDVVSSQRCPSLRELSVGEACGVDRLTIHSETHLLVDLWHLKGLHRLSIVAPALKELKLVGCFVQNQPVADISAPQLVLLVWRDSYDPSSVQLGNLGQLQRLRTSSFVVHSEHDSGHNRGIMKLLQLFRFIQYLHISLIYWQDIGNFPYSIEDITMLPLTTFLTMDVYNDLHNFGPGSFHMLRLCTGIRRLSLVLHTSRDLEPPCVPDCYCDQPADWKAEELSLNRLEKVEITGLRGADHEAVFVERLFSWATVLKEMRITFDYSVSTSKARELLQTLASFSRPETVVEFYMYHDVGKRSVYLLAPED